MRLDILEQGHKRRHSAALKAMRAIAGADDEVVKTSLYRPQFFGRPWLELIRQMLRGPSAWTPGERELFGAYVSHRNACPFCVGVHTHTATLGLGVDIDPDVLDNWREAGLGAKVTAMLGLLEKLTGDPEAVTASDVQTARDAGVSEAAMVDAFYVGFVFNVVNRLANAFGYEHADDVDRAKKARALHLTGYRIPRLLLR